MREQVVFARRLRREQTAAERRFWALLHPWRMSGWHFRRQAPIGPYVVDFVCKRQRLVIEIDGDNHYSDAGRKHDGHRTGYLAGLGYRVVRFINGDILENSAGVFAVMLEILGEPGSTPT